MKLILRQLINASDSLFQLGKKTAKELPIKAIYSIAKNLGIIQIELSAYEKTRNEVLNKYSIDGKDGARGLPQKNLIAYTEELDPILETELDLNIRVISLTDADIEKAGFTPYDLVTLAWMFILEGDK